MPKHTHYGSIVIAAAVLTASLPAGAQTSEQQKALEPSAYAPIRDATNAEMFSSKVQVSQDEQPLEKGSVSVGELAHPLRGKSKALIADAQRLLDRGERDKALVALQKALKDPDAQPYAYTMLGTEHLRVGDVNQALPELEAATALLPGLAANHFNLALALARLQRNDEAIAEAKRALQLDPAQSNCRFLLGAVLLRLGKSEEAQYYLKEAAVDIPAARKLISETTAQ